MKKILAMMMVMLIAVTAIFAASTNGATSVILNYGVKQTWTPSYSMAYAIENNNTFSTVEGLTIEEDLNELNENSLQVAPATDETGTLDNFRNGYIAIAISDKTAYNIATARFVTYTIDVNNWKIGTDGADGPTIALSDLKLGTGLDNSITTEAVSVARGKSFKVNYAENTSNLSGTAQEVARFAAYWEVASGVEYPVGDYTATMTIEVTGC